jgi:Rrf2 family protein
VPTPTHSHGRPQSAHARASRGGARHPSSGRAGRGPPRPGQAEQIANAQQIPPKYLQNILTQLRNAGLLESHRGGTEGGYRLARPADQITLANIIRAVDGPLTTVRGARPQSLHYPDPASHLPKVWIAVRVSLRSVLEQVTLPTWSPAPWPARSATSPTTRTPGSPTNLA